MSALHERSLHGGYLDFSRNGEVTKVHDFFLARGWEVTRGNNEILVPTRPMAVFGCGDERYKESEVPDDHRYGPSFFGATVGIAALRGEPTHFGIKRAALDISKAGFRAGMHGDQTHGLLGCGFNNLLLREHFNGVVGKPQIDLNAAKQMLVEELDGSYVDLRGSHTAVELNFNCVCGTTILPDGNGFVVDAWFPLTLAGVVPDRLLELTAATVEALKPDAKNVTIYT